MRRHLRHRHVSERYYCRRRRRNVNVAILFLGIKLTLANASSCLEIPQIRFRFHILITLATFLAIHKPRDLRIQILLHNPTGIPLVRPPFYLLLAMYHMALSRRRRIEYEGACWKVPWFVVDEATASDGVCVREDGGAKFFAGCE